MNNGIQPTVELATNNGNGFYPYPVMYGNNGGYGNGFFGGDGIWAIVLLALLFNGGWGGNNGGFFGGRGGFDDGYAWLSNGQKEILTNTNNGFDTLHLSNQLEGVRDGVYGISNQLCNCCADINANVSNGFYTAEVAASNRQIADMNQNFANQLNLQNNLNQLNSRFSDCCCENRLGIANLTSTILSENCADRAALSEGVRDIITNATSNTQAVLDKLCQLELDAKQDKIDAKNEKISDLQRELLMKDLQASQIQQTATLRLGQEAEVDALYNRLNNCPVPTTPVYGRTPIFTCPNNNGCGCNGNFYNYAANLI